jgi:hypothetical protein
VKENQEQLKRNFEFFKPFLQSINLSAEMHESLETVYYVPESQDTKGGYFVAEFWIPYCDGVFIKEKSFKISHVFRLDIQQIEVELSKLHDTHESRFKTILDPKNIAFVMQEHYEKFIPYLSGEHGKNDYKEITKLLYSYCLGTAIGTKQYGV